MGDMRPARNRLLLPTAVRPPPPIVPVLIVTFSRIVQLSQCRAWSLLRRDGRSAAPRRSLPWDESCSSCRSWCDPYDGMATSSQPSPARPSGQHGNMGRSKHCHQSPRRLQRGRADECVRWKKSSFGLTLRNHHGADICFGDPSGRRPWRHNGISRCFRAAFAWSHGIRRDRPAPRACGTVRVDGHEIERLVFPLIFRAQIAMPSAPSPRSAEHGHDGIARKMPHELRSLTVTFLMPMAESSR